MLLYYPGFDVAQITVTGERVAMSFEVEFYNITQDVTIDTLTADVDGHISAGSFDDATFDVAANDVVELRHATGPRTARLTLKTTADEAAEAAENDIATYIIQDDYTPFAPQTAPIYAQDLDNLDAPHIFLANVPIGASKIPVQTGVPKNYRLYVGSSEKDRQFSLNDVTQVNSFDLLVPASGGRIHPTTLFDIKEDIPTATSSLEDVHLFTVPANTLQYDGDKLHVRYAGRFETGSSKEITLRFGDDYYSTSTSATGNWAFDIDILRIAEDDFKYTVKFFSSSVQIAKGSLGSGVIDFSTDEDIIFQVDDDSAAETVLEMGYCLLIPAAEVDVTPPSIPANLEGTGGDGEILWTWDASTD